MLQARSAGNEALAEESERMRSKLMLSFFALSSLALLPAASLARNANQDRDDDRGKVREMTGCLQREGDDYELMADNGSTWELKGDRARLADARPISASLWRSRTNSATARSSANGSEEAKIRPHVASTRSWAQPTRSLTNTARPQAMASFTARPQVSDAEGRTHRSPNR